MLPQALLDILLLGTVRKLSPFNQRFIVSFCFLRTVSSWKPSCAQIWLIESLGFCSQKVESKPPLQVPSAKASESEAKVEAAHITAESSPRRPGAVATLSAPGVEGQAARTAATPAPRPLEVNTAAFLLPFLVDGIVQPLPSSRHYCLQLYLEYLCSRFFDRPPLPTQFT